MFYFEDLEKLERQELPPDPRMLAPELLIPGRKPTGKAMIDWEHPIAQKLHRCYLFQQCDATDFVDLVSGQRRAYTSVGTVLPYWSGADQGLYPGEAHWNIADLTDELPVANGSTDPVSVFVQFKWDTASLGNTGNLINGGHYSLIQQHYGNYPLTFGAAWSQTLSQDLLSGDDYIGKLATYCWTVDPANNDIIGRFNTNKYNSSGLTIDAWSSSLAFGYGHTDQYANPEGAYRCIYIFKGILSDAEYESLRKDPYQFLIPVNAPAPTFIDPEEDQHFMLPDSRLFAPELLVPNRKPTVPVEIDTLNKFSRHMSFATFADGNKATPTKQKAEYNYGDGGYHHVTTKGKAFRITTSAESDSEANRDWIKIGTTVDANKLFGSNPTTIVWAGIRKASSYAVASVASGKAQNNALRFTINISGNIDVVTRDADWQSAVFTGYGPAVDEFDIIVITWDGISTIKCYTNAGEATDSSSLSSSDFPTSDTPILIGQGYNSGGSIELFSEDHDVLFAAGFTKEFSAAEARDLRKNLYQMFKPATGPQVFDKVGAGGFHLPDSRLEMPELLIPGRKPTGKVMIDPDHTLAPDNICIVPSAKQPEELIRNIQPTLNGDTFVSGRGLEYADTDYTDLLEYTFDFELPLNATIMTGFVNTGAAINWNAALWSGIGGSGLFTADDNAVNEINITHLGASAGLTTPPYNIWNDSVYHTFALTVRPENATNISTSHYHDGEHYNGVYYVNITGYDNTYTGLYLRSTTRGGGGGVLGHTKFFYVWNRTLTDGEIKSLHNNPYQFLIPE